MVACRNGSCAGWPLGPAPQWSQGPDIPGGQVCDEPPLGLSSICVQVSSKETVSRTGSCERRGGLEQGETQPPRFCSGSDDTDHGGALVSAPATNPATPLLLELLPAGRAWSPPDLQALRPLAGPAEPESAS